jgi:hypothetical protein
MNKELAVLGILNSHYTCTYVYIGHPAVVVFSGIIPPQQEIRVFVNHRQTQHSLYTICPETYNKLNYIMQMLE